MGSINQAEDKVFMISLPMLIQCMSVTDSMMDRHQPMVSGALCIASRRKKCTLLLKLSNFQSLPCDFISYMYKLSIVAFVLFKTECILT